MTELRSLSELKTEREREEKNKGGLWKKER